MTVTDSRIEDASAKAATLIEALPWLNRFHGQTVVIKYGGHAMADEELRLAFAQDLVFLRYAGLRPVVVHGGGPQINGMLARLGMESSFTAGLRVTTPEAMEVVRMVLSGTVNKDIVGLINRHGPFAVGLSGEDAGTLTAIRKLAVVDGEPADIGLVGEIVATDPGAVEALLADGRIPVISSVAAGRDGEVYNVNADTAAAALAVALDAAKLVVLTDVAGLYRDWPSSAEVISELTAAELAGLLPGLSAGMIPKMEACLTAVRGGVPQAHVLDGRLQPRRPARDLHRLRYRHHGGARERGPVMSQTETLQKRFAAAFMPNYGVPPRGHHPRPGLPGHRRRRARVPGPDRRDRGELARARPPGPRRGGQPQVAKVAHTSNLFLHEREIELAERLLSLLGTDGRVFLANSGTEANEAAVKLVRRIQGPGRPVIVAAERSFHGRTLGSLALTGKESIRTPFGPYGLAVRFVPYGDADALRGGDRHRRGRRLPRARPGRERRGARPGGLPGRGARRPAIRPARCWCSTRSRAASAGPGRGSRTRRPASGPTCSPWPRGWAAGCRSGRASVSARPAPASPRGTTAPPSAGTRSPAPPPWRCSRRSSATACWPTSPRSASTWRPASAGSATRWSRACAAPGCGGRSC